MKEGKSGKERRRERKRKEKALTAYNERIELNITSILLITESRGHRVRSE